MRRRDVPLVVGLGIVLCAAPRLASADWLSLTTFLKSCTPPTNPAPAVKPASAPPPAVLQPTPSQTLKTQGNNQTPPQTQETTKTGAQTPQAPATQSQATGNTTSATQNPPAQTPATPSSTPTPQPTTDQNGQKLVSNVFEGTDIRDAFSEIASAAGVTIIPDDSIKSVLVYMEFRNEPIESAIHKLALLAGAYVKEQSPGVYLVSQALPESGLFREFAEVRNYLPSNQTAASLQALLPPNYKPYVEVDVKTNHLTVTAPSELMPDIIGNLKKIDIADRQFVVEALVTELDNTGDNDFGFSWGWQNFAVGTDLSLQYTQATQSDIATLKALITKGKATLRANPRLTAFEGQEATLTVGQETYFSILSGNVTFPTAQIQLIKTGVTLDFTGYIGDDGTITLNLQPEVSDAIVSVNGNPTTNVRKVSTMVRLKPGQTIAIGGLVQEMTSYSTTRVPFLGYIPLIGNLFSQKSNSVSKKEVIILITPYLSDTGVPKKGQDSDRPVPKP